MIQGLLLAALLAGCAWARAGDEAARRYAVLSLVGDQMTLVTFVPQTGSRMDTNLRQTVPVVGEIFDLAALKSIHGALGRADPGAKIELLASSNKELFNHQDRLFNGSKLTLPADTLAEVQSTRATHLVLLTKYRGATRLKMLKDYGGTGTIEGLGFYIDRRQPMLETDTGEDARGFLAPYVYARLSLIDLASSSVVQDAVITSTTTVTPARSKTSMDPWDAFAPEEKVEWLRGHLTRAIETEIPKLIAALPR